jgi:hypothetical protein
MDILHKDMQHNETNVTPSASSENLSDAIRYKEFCGAAGIAGTTEGYFLWLREGKGSASTPSLSLPQTVSDSPANSNGKITVTKLAAAGVLCLSFVTVKLLCGFSKNAFTMAALYELYRHLRHSAGMGEILPSPVWSLITMTNITPAICAEAAQYDREVISNVSFGLS